MLNQPAEFVIIGGAALGSLLISTPLSVLKKLVGQMQGAVRRRRRRKNDFIDLLAMLYQLFKVAQQTGVMALESHFEEPDEEPDPVEVSEVPRAPSRRRLPGRLGSR